MQHIAASTHNRSQPIDSRHEFEFFASACVGWIRSGMQNWLIKPVCVDGM